MGLFSFIKNAGSKIFGKKKEEEAPVQLSKIDALKAEVTKLGIPVEGLDVELCEQVIVHGRTGTTEDAEIYYTTDGTDPDETSTPYTDLITLTSTTTIKARAYKEGK